MKRLALCLLVIMLAFTATLTSPRPVQADPVYVTASVDLPVVTRMDTQVVRFSSDGTVVVSTLNGEPVSDGQAINMFWRELGTYTLSVTAVKGEEVAMSSASFEMVVTLESLRDTIILLCQTGYINKESICRAYPRKINNAIRMRDLGYGPHWGDFLLNVIARDVQRRTTVGTVPAISPAIGQMIIGDIQYLLAH